MPKSKANTSHGHGDEKRQKTFGDDISNNVTISKGDVGSTCDVKDTKAKKQKGFKAKKTVTGLSNWSILCSELKKDPCSRRKNKVKKSCEIKDPGPPAKKPKPEIWFDDVDESLLESDDDTRKKDQSLKVSVKNVPPNVKSLVKKESFQGKTKCIGMDCEMVGAGPGGSESILARVSLVNVYGHCLYDKYVKPREKVTDYRTFVSGITKELIEEKGEAFLKVQKEVSELIQGSVLVGHALQNDLRVLFLSHPFRDTRDTSTYRPHRELFGGKMPSLKKLTEKILGVTVQEGQHSSVEDAQAAMRIYTVQKKKWEKMLKDVRKMRKMRSQKKKKKKGSIDEEEETALMNE